ncbi:MAG: tRNA uridine-5-carboxymethylaminomethyl(34) synthesis GTPase MnmE [Candidatus Gastranaerophilales bacterium]|nr:tRNA uridine-5-carboxymethylaminomethyl(34) synthesis GTPase MnmE [Candidatus Gastranaerophilales bacterium]
MSNFFDTIAAIATPIGFGGIGIIRVSGSFALSISEKIFEKKIIPNKINHGWIIYKNKKIDEAVVLYFKSPNSFTGEDVVEFQTHGSPVVIKEILEIILNEGARYAQKGEFTKRAFLNRKMDLTEAEAVLELINAKSAKSASKSALNLSGALSSMISELRNTLIQILAKITASIDFPEDVAEVSHLEIINALVPVKEKIEEVLKNASAHNILREGIKIAIIGRPNVGKSSLFNALLGLKRAIVTEIEGTTRDIITETFEIDGICATLVDTAGIRENENADMVEKIGIEQAKNAALDADIVLMLYDGAKGITPFDEEIFSKIKNKKRIFVAAKSDISNKTYAGSVSISSKTGENIELLKEKIKECLTDINIDANEFTTNQRQQESLKNALLAIENALFAAKENELIDLISIDIKSALVSLGEICGEVVNDEILDSIFDKFCIGK